MKKIWLSLFVLTSVSELVAIIIPLPMVHSIAKPLLLPLLIAYWLISTPQRNRFFLLSLLFCWIGDVLLMFQGDRFFILGLVSFLTGHVFYMASYLQLRAEKGIGLLPTQKIRFSLPIVLAGSGLVTILYPHLGGLKIPVMIYAMVITIMTMQALFRLGFTSTKSFSLIFIGAIFFMVSDAALAINKFMHVFPMASLVIMSTYIIAQYLIVEGAIAHYTSHKSNGSI